MKSTSPPQWECCACTQAYVDFTATWIDGEEPICSSCLKKMFKSAFESEYSYPPRWGGYVLHPKDFKHIIDKSFIEKYEKREQEYETPARTRLYCDCGSFLGASVEGKGDSQVSVVMVCRKCNIFMCMKCSTPHKDAAKALYHDCSAILKKRKVAELASESEAFHGLKPGVDHQICPSQGCGRRVQLRDACNHMTCLCGTDFCFVCGVEAEEESGH